MMTAKEYLMQIRTLDSMIKNIEDEIQSLREETASLRSAWPDGQPRGTGTTDPVGAQAVKIADQLTTAERTHLTYMREMYRKREEILNVIEQVNDGECQRLLYLRYVQGYSWEAIAEDIDKSRQWTCTAIHSKALQIVEKILST